MHPYQYKEITMPPGLIGALGAIFGALQTAQQILQVVQTFVNFVSPPVQTYQDSNKTEADDNTYLDALNDTVLPKVQEQIERNGGRFEIPDRVDSAVELNDLNVVLEKMVAQAGELGLSNDEVSQLKKAIETNKEVAGNLTRRGLYDDKQNSAKASLANTVNGGNTAVTSSVLSTLGRRV
jgi:hypothetical protein